MSSYANKKSTYCIKEILLSIFLPIVFLSACSSTGINVSAPEATADYLKEELSLTHDIQYSQEEYFHGIVGVYSIGPHVDLVLDNEDNIEQINFNSLDNKSVYHILELVEFPESSSIDELIDDYYTQIAATGSYENASTFTSHKNLGVRLSTNMDVLKMSEDEKPFNLSLYYNPDRFEQLRELSL